MSRDKQPASSKSWREWVLSLPPSEQEALCRATTPRLTEYVPHKPTAPQAAFLLLDNREALYGGAAGGGKSDALLMGALQYVDVPGYSAILFRKTYADLARPGALMDRAHSWLAPTAARWNEQKKAWRFPSGATLTFGYLEHASDIYSYQGAEYQFIGFDELTQFEERGYKYLSSRLRRLVGAPVPLRMRSASNPGGAGHQWVFQRFFIEGQASGRVFVPAKLEDNPHLDRGEYEESLAVLDPITRAQLRNGDWTAIDRSNALCPEWTPELALACTRHPVWPPWLTAYRVMDVGSRDLTVVLFAFWDFVQAKLCVVGEVVLRDPSTRQIGEAIQSEWRRLFGGHEGVESVHSYSDIDWRLIRDLREDFKLEFLPTAKTDHLAAHNGARSFIGEGRLVVSPECKTTLATLAGATWNDKRTDYQRTDALGHADAWATLVYLIRNVKRDRNPYPPAEMHPLEKKAAPLTKGARALQSAWGTRIKPL